MAKAQASVFPFPPKRVYYGANVPMRVIRRYAWAIAEEFRPEKIILFGSYAYGTPHEDSDVDLLVIMPTRNQHDQAVRIQYRLTAPFPLDLIVRKPQQVQRRLAEKESFLTSILSHGKVLYGKRPREHGSRRQRRITCSRYKPVEATSPYMMVFAFTPSNVRRPRPPARPHMRQPHRRSGQVFSASASSLRAVRAHRQLRRRTPQEA
jgi:uncharacterized protein